MPPTMVLPASTSAALQTTGPRNAKTTAATPLTTVVSEVFSALTRWSVSWRNRPSTAISSTPMAAPK
jgi:hypothetical protein